jgi:glycosyltransferase involved in cell wall biosynthesis
MRDEYARHGVEIERLVIAGPPPFGLEAAMSPPRPPPESGRLLFVGRVTAVKGLDHLVAAIPHASERLGRPLSITVTGDGPALAAAERLAAELGVSLNSTKWLEGEDRARVFEEHELLVMPSVWPEPWGMAGLEAATRGLPTAAYASGGIPEWLTPGVSGELAPANPPTVRGLSDALVRALADREHYARLSRGAWEMARRHATASHVATIESVLRRALEG